MALPARLGGLGILNPSEHSTLEIEASLKVTQPLTEVILQRRDNYSYDTIASQITAKSEVASVRRTHFKDAEANLRDSLTGSLRRALELAQKGSSSWQTVLPIHGFCLHKGAFLDAITLRYGLTRSHLPSSLHVVQASPLACDVFVVQASPLACDVLPQSWLPIITSQ